MKKKIPTYQIPFTGTKNYISFQLYIPWPMCGKTVKA